MTPEEREAEALARWLEDPRQPPPDDLDPEVVEAVLCLKPELAPPPRVTADEILGDVRSGPLARPPSAIAEDPAIAPDLAQAAANRPTGLRSPWVRWAAGGGAAAVLAAALVTLVLLPALPPVLEDQASPALQATAPMEAPEAEEDRPEAAAESQPRGEIAQGSELRVDERSVGESVASRSAEMPPPPRTAEPKPTDPSPRPKPPPPPSADMVAGGRAEAPRSAPAPAPASARPSPRASEDLDEDAVADLEAEAPSEEALDSDLLSGSGAESVRLAEPDEAIEEEADEEAFALDAEDYAPVSEARSRTTTSRKGRAAARAPTLDVERDAQPEASAPSPPAPAQSRSETAPEPDVTYLERDARPRGPLNEIAHPAAKQLGGGDPRAALDELDALLERSGLSRVEQADLHWVRGRALVELERVAEARRSFEESIRLRER